MLLPMRLSSNTSPVVVRPLFSLLLEIKLTRTFSNYQGHCERPYILPNSLAYPWISPLGFRTPSLSKSHSFDRRSVCYVGKQLPYP